jgi:hypothetical protein
VLRYVDDLQLYVNSMREPVTRGTVAIPDIPEPLELWLQCDKYGSLPFSGGVLEQPYLLWTEMQAAGNAYEETLRLRGNSKAQGAA